MRRRAGVVRPLAVLGASCLVALACSGGGGRTTAPTTAPTDTPTDAPTVSLKGLCPDKIVLQTDWFPESEHGFSYQLIGTGGTTDKGKGTYTGPLLDPNTGRPTGVSLEIRAGGPFIGFQPPVAQMYSDDSIFVAYADTADQIRNSKKLPTVAVMAPLNRTPLILMYDPTRYHFTSLADIGKSGAKVLYFEGVVFMDYLVSKGLINKSQLDGSYDGSPARFVADNGADVQQGFATREPYEYEHTISGWMKPVKYLLVDDAGYKIYQSALVVRPETIIRYGDCLRRLVPLFQAAMVKYLARPQPVNDQLLDIVRTLATSWTLSKGGSQFTVDQMKSLKIVANSPDGSYGSFDDTRVQTVIDEVLPIFKNQHLDSYKPDVKPSDLVTNQFLNTSVKLP
ncbi:MAG: hypothetical protein QOG44_3873 [Acidimicrobiaceae bacterium]|nr:hypothetical protein [Acidimicrobiaceae bacterium]MDQ1443060.1 hypothetical protein [Acidimicrobiaceae bacterium]